ncbi:fatty acyl CoA synthetase [Luteimonas sp. M1R5S59]|uniref:Fatty acyl CoA synthetase n=2 Tax=Luteimonas kalidii TaxID=3042025 RepID=A0ABT6JS02_9GAMM|nr:LolA-related protein [Luteimonas kalidii]MDH5833247.1 fatty acyl CoA synthetase [Luteimonas kalidii]
MAPSAWAQASPDSGAILRALARPVPAATPFVEVRESQMLKAPLRVSGEYRRPDAGTLVREVRAPYAETTTIRDGEAVLARAGKPDRRFPLARAPELAALHGSFGALLAGDAETLRRHYTIDAQGGADRWSLRLVPRDPKLAARLRDLVLHGRGADLHCIENTPVKGDVQRTLTGVAAEAAIRAGDAADIAALCRGGAGVG